jgi:FkbM family methyltransferase
MNVSGSLSKSSSFSFSQSGIALLCGLLRVKIFRHITAKASSVFVYGNGPISLEPLIFGTYEAGLSALIQYFANSGYNDTLIDIGANIGLTTYYNHSAFRSIHCFEPNPKSALALQANLYGVPNVMIHQYGLGGENKNMILKVPVSNIGGAFIDNSGNTLSKDALAAKEGIGNLEEMRYETIPVEIKRGRDALATIFTQSRSSVIKIDVEGYEETVLRELAAALPATYPAVIIFENWDPQLDVDKLFGWFARKGKKLKLMHSLGSGSVVTKILRALFTDRTYYLTETPPNWLGEIVFIFNGSP